MNPHSYAHLTFDKGAKNIYDAEKTASSTNVEVVICLQKTETRSMFITLY
jgi:hypothetical protein